MGLLDSVIGAIGQSKPGSGGQTDLMTTVVALLGAMGGLSGLMQKFQANGLGDIVQSWISQGENKPISPEQLRDVLGHETVAGVSQQTGLEANDALAQLSRMLPMVVDKLSPKGQVPEDGQGGLSDLSGLAGMLGGLFKP